MLRMLRNSIWLQSARVTRGFTTVSRAELDAPALPAVARQRRSRRAVEQAPLAPSLFGAATQPQRAAPRSRPSRARPPALRWATGVLPAAAPPEAAHLQPARARTRRRFAWLAPRQERRSPHTAPSSGGGCWKQRRCVLERRRGAREGPPASGALGHDGELRQAHRRRACGGGARRRRGTGYPLRTGPVLFQAAVPRRVEVRVAAAAQPACLTTVPRFSLCPRAELLVRASLACHRFIRSLPPRRSSHGALSKGGAPTAVLCLARSGAPCSRQDSR